jgi:hypothetical protein
MPVKFCPDFFEDDLGDKGIYIADRNKKIVTPVKTPEKIRCLYY